MPRALSIQRSIIPAADREKYLERLASKRAHYESKKCRYWVFEEQAIAGAFLEFIESDTAAALAAAFESAPEPPLDRARIYIEVELT